MNDVTGYSDQPFYLDEWRVDPGALLITRKGEQKVLRAQAMALLVLLAKKQGQTVSREDIIQTIWAGNELTAAQGINNAIWSIRQALGDTSSQPRYLHTVPKKGYRLIASVTYDTAQKSRVESEINNAIDSTTENKVSHTERDRQEQQTKQRLLFMFVMLAVLTISVTAFIYFARQPESPMQYSSSASLTDLEGMEYLGRVSPDGKWLALAWWKREGGGGLYLRDRQNRAAALKTISSPDIDITSMAWSPDGHYIAYTQLEKRQTCLLMMYHLISGETQQLDDCAPVWTPILAWSADGRWLLFSKDARSKKIVSEKVQENNGGLFVRDQQTGATRQLTYSPDTGLPDHQPAWHHDSQHFAFVRAEKNGDRDIYLGDLNGHVSALTQWRLPTLHGISWTRDGREIVFSSSQQSTRLLSALNVKTQTRRELGIEGSAPHIDSNGLIYSLLKKHQRLAKLNMSDKPFLFQVLGGSVAGETQPDYSSERRALAFLSSRSGTQQLWIANVDGSGARQLSDLPGYVGEPVWANHSGNMAFAGDCHRNGQPALCVVNSGDGRYRRVDTFGWTVDEVVWSDADDALYALLHSHASRTLWRLSVANAPAQKIDTRFEPLDIKKLGGDPFLYYRSADKNVLHRIHTVTGAEDIVPIPEALRHYIAWLPLPDGVLFVQRDAREQWWLLSRSGEATLMGETAIGQLAEFPDMSFDAQRGELYVELMETAQADLMLATEQTR